MQRILLCFVLLSAKEKLAAGCGGLNENAPHRLRYLNTQSPVGDTVWDSLRGVALQGCMPLGVL